jgi:hypothetical protein
LRNRHGFFARFAIEKPPIISFASANGPSTSFGWPPRTCTRTASLEDVSASAASSLPRSLRSAPKRTISS